ncbi:hypothetical protein CDAR_306231 [Caerostris darwini]|uniref:Uncharacterized protein n=1 Tax=Caerostris darwini TaxID=1538125 RepID=A0AAV4VCV3_9ARAC|nr:hypothetical protein CDAR_306231 [Caerostris darwini]
MSGNVCLLLYLLRYPIKTKGEINCGRVGRSSSHFQVMDVSFDPLRFTIPMDTVSEFAYSPSWSECISEVGEEWSLSSFWNILRDMCSRR